MDFPEDGFPISPMHTTKDIELKFIYKAPKLETMISKLCGVCVKSEILCEVCSKKLKEGELTETEVRITRFLASLEEKVKSLKSAKLETAVETPEEILIIAAEGSGSKFVGRGGSVARLLTKKFGKPVRVFETSDDPRRLLEEILGPNLVTVGKVYSPEGEFIRIRVRKGAPTDLARAVAEAVYRGKVEVVPVDNLRRR